jgi:hypothetical protein
MANDKHVYHFKLDFLYQAIAVYAGTIVLYLFIRGWFVEKEFSIVWRDPILYLLCAITLVSILALLYYVLMKRRIEVEGDTINFVSAVRRRSIKRSDVESVRIGRETGSKVLRGMRVVSIRLRDRRRPVRIRPTYFNNGQQLASDLQRWAGPLLQVVNRPAIGIKPRRS